MIKFDPIWSNLIQSDSIWSKIIKFINPTFMWYHFYENTAIILMWFLDLDPPNLSRLWIPTRSSRSKMIWNRRTSEKVWLVLRSWVRTQPNFFCSPPISNLFTPRQKCNLGFKNVNIIIKLSFWLTRESGHTNFWKFH